MTQLMTFGSHKSVNRWTVGKEIEENSHEMIKIFKLVGNIVSTYLVKKNMYCRLEVGG